MSLQSSSPTSSSFRFYGKKEAVLVGVTYTGEAGALNGPVNDVKLLHNMLVKDYNFNPSSIVILSDADTGITDSVSLSATRKDILMGLRLLVDSADPGDSLWFSYSGHGNKVVDESGDEIDGFDETIRPSDYATAGEIIDDEMYDIIKDLPEGCRFTALFDCCNSGTLLDLPYEYKIKASNITMKCTADFQKVSKRQSVKNLLSPLYVEVTKELNDAKLKGPRKKLSKGLFGALKGTAKVIETGVPVARKVMKEIRKDNNRDMPSERTVETLKAEILCLGGSEDHLPSEDALIESTGLCYGQLTYAFVTAQAEENVNTYKELLLCVQEKLKKVKFMSPQFSTSHEFDVESKFQL